jgi:hypothetical protein
MYAGSRDRLIVASTVWFHMLFYHNVSYRRSSSRALVVQRIGLRCDVLVIPRRSMSDRLVLLLIDLSTKGDASR